MRRTRVISREFWLITSLAVVTATIMPWSTELYKPLYAQYGDDLLETEEETKEAIEDRLEDIRETGKWGLFINYSYTDIDRDETKRQEGYTADAYRVTLGADYARPEFVLGGAFSYSREDQDSSSDVEIDDYTVVAYGSYFPQDSDFFVDGLITYGMFEYDISRDVLLESETFSLTSEPDGYRVGGGVNLGYNWRQGPWTLGSIAELNYTYIHLDDYRESGPDELAASFESRSSDSLTLGGSFILSRAISTDWGVILPQLRMTYVHEFLNDSEIIRGEIQDQPILSRTDNPDRDFFFGAIGVSAVTPSGLQFFADYEQRFGHRYLDTYQFTLGLRYEF